MLGGMKPRNSVVSVSLYCKIIYDTSLQEQLRLNTCNREWIFGDLQVLKRQYIDLQGWSKITHKLRQMWAWMQIDIQLYHFPYRNPSNVALQNYRIMPFPTERFFFSPPSAFPVDQALGYNMCHFLTQPVHWFEPLEVLNQLWQLIGSLTAVQGKLDLHGVS